MIDINGFKVAFNSIKIGPFITINSNVIAIRRPLMALNLPSKAIANIDAKSESCADKGACQSKYFGDQL